MNAEQRLDMAHALMLVAFIGFITATLNAYVWDFTQGMGVQILSHILMLVFPVVFKLSYVLRLHSLRSMGLEAH
jgi:ABC-type polysaccharide/polyol phosphate export permease